MSHSVIESNGFKVEVKGKRVWINGDEVNTTPHVKRIDFIQVFMGVCIGFSLAIILNSAFG